MKNEEKITRVVPSLEKGLSNSEAQKRSELGLTNKTNIVVGKTYLEIIFSDVFSFFNILLFAIFGLMIAAQYWAGLPFIVVLLANIGISLYQDIKARRLMSKLRVLTQPRANILRDCHLTNINSKDIVLDDLIQLKSEDQICVDGKLLSGSLIVNESALTGESKNIIKKVGDMLYSGSYVVSGTGYMHAEKIGEESYIETIQSKAKKFKRSPSEILKALTYMFRVIGSIVVILAASTFIIYAVRGAFNNYESFKQVMKGISGSMISMIPAGLFLLTSVALAVAVLKLSKKGARIQDFYSVEMLARINVLCVDKTGTITSGEMDVKKVIMYGPNGYSNTDVAQIISNLLHATKDSNLTAKSLQKAFNYEMTKGVIKALPFNSENKYSAASFTGGETYVLGAPEFLNISNTQSILRRVEEYTSQGLRTLVLGKVNKQITGDKVDGEVTPIAIIVLQDHIRDEAIETFNWFKQNGVAIKVISGDDANTVSHIATEAGIEAAEKYISLAGLSDEEVIEAAKEYVVFGRVTPEQKEIIIKTLKSEGKTVGMTGDGVNDILALKRADCSIAMNSGSEAAKNVSHIVLVNSDFASLPSVVNEGRRVINNLQRTAALFLVKTIFSVVTTTVFLITMVTSKVSYPFEATHFQLWSVFNIGISAFFLALERNNEPLKGSFVGSIFRKAIPGSLVLLIPVAVIYLLFALQTNHILYTGIYTFENATTMCVLTFTILGLFILLKICLPLNLYRSLVLGGATLIEAGFLIAAGFISYNVKDSESQLYKFGTFGIDFPTLTLVNWFVIAIIIVITVATYLIITYVVEVLRGEHQDVKNQSRSRKGH